MKIALAGNPNCGKTSIFNALTGAHQHVGNYPGVTIEKTTGNIKYKNHKFEFIDLPGTYSLSAYAEDEIIARKFLIHEKPDLIINVVDVMNFERNLYLTTQLMELNIPIIVALNKCDVAFSQGYKIDEKKMESMLGCPIIFTVGHKKQCSKNLLKAIISSIKTPKKGVFISYGTEINKLIKNISTELIKDEHLQESLNKYNIDWFAIKLSEGDEEIIEILRKNSSNFNEYLRIIKSLSDHIRIAHNNSIENLISDYRYGFANGISKNCLLRPTLNRKTITDKLDSILTNKILGPISLLLILIFLYHFTFKISEYPISLLESFFSILHNIGMEYIPKGEINSLIVSGIIDGVGGVLSFTPLIICMFLVITFLEDSGYITRIAFLMDRLLRTFGMHGNSILAFIVAGGISGGCAVPGIMATRTLYDKKERLATILTVPFMNCGAKLPVFALMIAAFFPSYQGALMFLLTMISWFFALIMAGIIRKTLLRGDPAPFIMELPFYNLPTIQGLFIHTWHKTWMYLKKAGTFILLATIIMWFFMNYPKPPQNNIKHLSLVEQNKISLEYSLAGKVGKTLEYITKPINGFNWKMNIALIGGAAAKEVIVSTLATAHSLKFEKSDAQLGLHLKNNPYWTPLLAFSFILFVMLYMPCIAVIAVMKKETGHWRWAFFSIFYNTALAFFVSGLVFQIGTYLSRFY